MTSKRHDHRPSLCYDPDYERDRHEHPTRPPENPDYPDRRIYGDYASAEPPPYVPHPLDQSCFKPREKDCKRPVTCYEPEDGRCLRIDNRAMTADQQARFLNAFMQVNANNALAPLVAIHNNSTHQMHSDPRFLPWHRIYLLRFEQLLQMADPSVCLPYWRSSDEQAFPGWLSGFLPTVGGHPVWRNLGLIGTLPDAGEVNQAMNHTSFNAFAAALEGIHNSGHSWVGGSMGSIPTAPTDPIFWMHHCEIDRIWAEWQAAHPNEHPSLPAPSDIMDPWSENETDTRDIAALGYAYA